ncbi:hypothetical protein SDC9_156644 [bioreactor metagenome]|uniref:Uncharacterized protein n=1 Tax=bioreactor metagenome TaxID=1076179 RepID=A0A645F4T9_9ZZZZ
MTDFCLVGSIGTDKLFPGCDMLDDTGYVVPIGSGAAIDIVKDGIGISQGLQLFEGFKFTDP